MGCRSEVHPRVGGETRERVVRRLGRGDGPLERHPMGGTYEVSPPTRGWTLLIAACIRQVTGFPATRGWTLALLFGEAGRFGFPAHAGMDLLARPFRRSLAWFPPPTRGWTLLMKHRILPAEGFPAHAGMDRTPTSAATGRRRFPRPRGDGPSR